jgi:hypothetical protein
VTLVIPSGVTATGSTLSSTRKLIFTNCTDYQFVTFGSAAQGNYAINGSVADAGVGTYNYNANWTLKVNAPPTPADTTKPVLSLPANITAEATSASGAAVTYTATAMDNIDGAITPTCSPTSGSLFALGTTTVNCSATDAAGNTGTGSFAVTVRDTTAPSLSNMPGDQTVEATSASGAVATYSAPTATDAVTANPTVTCLPASGSTFALGATTVSCTAKDAANNQSAARTFTITVQDTTAPTGITFSTTGVQDGGSYLRNFVPAQPTCSATDLVTATPTCVVTGYSNAAGTHQLTATATDGARNSSTKTLSYTVRTLTISAFGSRSTATRAQRH